MTLPASRNQTYVDSTPVHPGDMNDIQDCIIAGKHGPRPQVIHPVIISPGSWAADVGNLVTMLSSGATPGTFALPAQEGDRILGCRLMAYGDGAADVTYTLYVLKADVSSVLIGHVDDPDRAAAWGEVTLGNTGGALGFPYTLQADEGLFLRAAPSAANARFQSIRLEVDRP